MRRFLRRDLLKVGLFAPALALLGGCTEWVVPFFPTRKSKLGDKITVPGTPGEYPVGSVTVVREGKFYLTRVPEGFLALYWRCTHLGCTVPWKPAEELAGTIGLFRCPCHGSTYLITGQNVAGPAPRPLDAMHLEVAGNRIVVDTGRITKRIRWEPEQAVQP